MNRFLDREPDLAGQLNRTFVVVQGERQQKQNKNESFLKAYPRVSGVPHFYVLDAKAGCSSPSTPAAGEGKSYDGRNSANLSPISAQDHPRLTRQSIKQGPARSVTVQGLDNSTNREVACLRQTGHPSPRQGRKRCCEYWAGVVNQCAQGTVDLRRADPPFSWRSGDPASNPRTPRRFWRSTPMPWCPSFRMRIFTLWESNTIIRYLATRHGANVPLSRRGESQGQGRSMD